MTDPIEHAKAAMEQALIEMWTWEKVPTPKGWQFDPLTIAVGNAKHIDIQFWGRKYSQTIDSRTVRLTSTLRSSFEQDDLSAFIFRPARHNIVHEAWHVVQAQGRSRIGWLWNYLWNMSRLEREADAMAVKYRDQIR